jgi:hypothetical protein
MCRKGQAGVDIVIPVVLPAEPLANTLYDYDRIDKAERSTWTDSMDEFIESDDDLDDSAVIEMKKFAEKMKQQEPGNFPDSLVSCICIKVTNFPDDKLVDQNFCNPWGARIFCKDNRIPALTIKHILKHSERICYAQGSSNNNYNYSLTVQGLGFVSSLSERLPVPPLGSGLADSGYDQLQSICSTLLERSAELLRTIDRALERVISAGMAPFSQSITAGTFTS